MSPWYICKGSKVNSRGPKKFHGKSKINKRSECSMAQIFVVFIVYRYISGHTFCMFPHDSYYFTQCDISYDVIEILKIQRTHVCSSQCLHLLAVLYNYS